MDDKTKWNNVPAGARWVLTALGGALLAGSFTVVLAIGLIGAAIRSIVAYLFLLLFCFLLYWIFDFWQSGKSAETAALYLFSAYVIGELIYLARVMKSVVTGEDPPEHWFVGKDQPNPDNCASGR